MKDEELCSYDSKKSESKLSTESKLSVNERVDHILAVTDESGISLCSESCYSSGSSCDSHESDSEEGEEGQESILSSRYDGTSAIPEDRIFVKLPGVDEEACAPTESNFTDDVPFGRPDDESQVQGFTKKNLRLNRSMLAVSMLVLILGAVALYIVFFVVGVPPSN